MPSVKECGLSLQAVEEYADYIRKIVDQYEPNLRGRELADWLVTRLKGEAVIPSMWGTDNSGSLVVRSKTDFTIHLSPYTSPLHDVFTIIHELGHYFLHCDFDADMKEVARFNRVGSNREEWQANRFAAALLMPKAEFQKEWTKYDKNPWMVGAYFGVSSSAARIRAETLGL